MISIKETNTIKAVKKTFISLYEENMNPSDPELLKEDTLSLELLPHDNEYRIYLKDNKLQINPLYDNYFQNGFDLAKLECEYWTDELISSGKVKDIISYLRLNEYSKRAILLTWKDEQKDLTKPAECMSYAFFRKSYNTLNINIHMRANNAFNYMLIDIDTMRIIQKYIAGQLNLEVGNYTHFIDSLHFYTKNKIDIDKLYFKWKNEEN